MELSADAVTLYTALLIRGDAVFHVRGGDLKRWSGMGRGRIRHARHALEAVGLLVVEHTYTAEEKYRYTRIELVRPTP